MTVIIKDKDNSIVGTAESISINVKYGKDMYQPIEIVRDKQGNYISSKPIEEPIELKGELLIDFNLVNPVIDLGTLKDKYSIEATQGYLNETKFDGSLLKLITCKSYNNIGGKANGISGDNLSL